MCCPSGRVRVLKKGFPYGAIETRHPPPYLSSRVSLHSPYTTHCQELWWWKLVLIVVSHYYGGGSLVLIIVSHYLAVCCVGVYAYPKKKNFNFRANLCLFLLLGRIPCHSFVYHFVLGRILCHSIIYLFTSCLFISYFILFSLYFEFILTSLNGTFCNTVKVKNLKYDFEKSDFFTFSICAPENMLNIEPFCAI